MLAFTISDYREMVRQFASKVPSLLAGHPATADLSIDVARLNIEEALEGRFTVAVVGQMRVGKSTLLNALMERELAPTGVNETTATINWFRYAEGALCERFRVHWIDGSSEDHPLQAVQTWLGQGKHVSSTRRLDFFANTSFLQTINLVDTPGTRSVLDTHEGATRNFILDEALVESHEQATLKSTARADAILYVLNPVARENDKDILSFFGEKTRMDGSSIHNSLAVIQKWENLSTDALGAAQEKCFRIQQQLDGKVALVLPSSGLMARYASRLPTEFWGTLALIAQVSASDFNDLTESPEFFCDSDSTFTDVPINQATRKNILSCASWPIIRFALREARRCNLSTGEQLQRAIYRASGITQLNKALAERFFVRSELIKANTLLRRAWLPCSMGLARLKSMEDDRKADVDRGRACQRVLNTSVMDESTRQLIKTHVDRSQVALELELERVRQIRQELDALQETARVNYEALDSDMKCIEALGDLSKPLAPDLKQALLSLWGLYGTSIQVRLQLPEDASLEESIQKADKLLGQWQRFCTRGSPHAMLFEHATLRLNAILDTLESSISG